MVVARPSRRPSLAVGCWWHQQGRVVFLCWLSDVACEVVACDRAGSESCVLEGAWDYGEFIIKIQLSVNVVE